MSARNLADRKNCYQIAIFVSVRFHTKVTDSNLFSARHLLLNVSMGVPLLHCVLYASAYERISKFNHLVQVLPSVSIKLQPNCSLCRIFPMLGVF